MSREFLLYTDALGSTEGIGLKTVNRVNKLALLYKYDGTNVVYLKGEKWLKVPPIHLVISFGEKLENKSN